MASGAVVGFIHEVMPPATLFAAFGARAGGSTPAERVPYWAFDAATAEYLDFYCRLQGYAGGGLTVTLAWMAASATSNNCIWRAAVRRIADDAEDLDSSHTYDYNSVTAGAPTLSGELSYDNITFTNGADMDSLANGEEFILRIGRDAANGSDNMTGDAQLLGVVIKET
jgi:hypothetical protein